MKMVKINHDIIALPENDGKWIIMNVFTKTCLAVDSSCFELLKDVEHLTDSVLNKKYRKKNGEYGELRNFRTRMDCLLTPLDM